MRGRLQEVSGSGLGDCRIGRAGLRKGGSKEFERRTRTRQMRRAYVFSERGASFTSSGRVQDWSGRRGESVLDFEDIVPG